MQLDRIRGHAIDAMGGRPYTIEPLSEWIRQADHAYLSAVNAHYESLVLDGMVQAYADAGTITVLHLVETQGRREIVSHSYPVAA